MSVTQQRNQNTMLELEGLKSARPSTRKVLAVLAGLLSLSGVALAQDNIVFTEGGAVRGLVRNGALEFRGIPFAAAPTGALRWSQPRSAPAWQGVRDGASFGPACPQEARFNLTERSEAEDCLSINVSVPADRKPGEKLPVFFYIHGGAFVGGSGSLYRLDKLAREGRMVVVTANYRVGVLGFLSHPALSKDGFNGNYGLEDQRFAMGWVQRNIGLFGGDPGNVTVAGESAGAGSICMHLASPERATGLFHKAFILSAGCFSRLKTVAEAEESGTWLVRSVGCGLAPDPAACMRSKSVSEWLAAQGRFAQMDPTDLIAISPVVGDRSLPRFPRDAAVPGGRMITVPTMMGGARNELRLYVGYAVQAGNAITPQTYPQALKLFYGDNAAAVAKEYPPGDSPPATLGSVLSSYNPGLAINNCIYHRTANAFAKRLPLYEFEFADRNAPVLGVGIAPPDPGFELGAVHSAAVNYLFPNYSNTARINAPDLKPESQRLADQMVAYVSAFARTGKPDVTGLPAWPAYGGPSDVMLWDVGKVGPYDGGAYHRCGFWRGLYPEYL